MSVTDTANTIVDSDESKEYNHVVMDMGKLKWNAAGQYVKHSCSILVISGFLFSILYMTQKLQ